MDQIKLYNLLRNTLKMTDRDAEEFVSVIGTVADRGLDARIQTLATKDDILATKEDIRQLALATKDDILDTKEDIRQLALATKDNIKDLSDKIYTRIFLSGVVQIITIVGSILAIVKFIK